MLNQGRWNLILDRVEFTDMGALPDILDFTCYLQQWEVPIAVFLVGLRDQNFLSIM